MLILGNCISTSATTVKKEFLTRFELQFNESKKYVIVEDFDLWLRIAFNGGRFHFIHKPLGEYVINTDNLSLDNSKARGNLCNLMNDHVHSLPRSFGSPIFLFEIICIGHFLQEVKLNFIRGNFYFAFKQVIRFYCKFPLQLSLYLTIYIQTKAKLFFEIYLERFKI